LIPSSISCLWLEFQKKEGTDSISEEDKEKLLATLRKAHRTNDKPVQRKKITLTKRHTSEIKQADPSGKSRTIQVEVRKKRVFVKKPINIEKTEDGIAIEESSDSFDEVQTQQQVSEPHSGAEIVESGDDISKQVDEVNKSSDSSGKKDYVEGDSKKRLDDLDKSTVDTEVAEINAYITSDKKDDKKTKDSTLKEKKIKGGWYIKSHFAR
jgi:translation initiation factor IF-2